MHIIAGYCFKMHIIFNENIIIFNKKQIFNEVKSYNAVIFSYFQLN